MKKFTFIALGIAALSLMGCRQQDEVFTNEDNANLEVLKRVSNSNTAIKDSVSIQSNLAPEDGDPMPPPKK